MKKRRLAIACFILVACLVMGIGFAELSRVLDVTTKMAINENVENFPVEIIDYTATLNSSSFDLSGATLNTEGTSLIITVPSSALVLKDDTLVLTLTIENKSTSYQAVMDSKATIQAAVANNVSEYVSVTIGDYSDADGILDVNDGATSTDDTTTITITYKLDQPPLVGVSGKDIVVRINATARIPA